MFLYTSPRPLEVPNFSSEQIECTIRSIEQKKQKLEGDIARYIREKQEELQKYEHQALSEHSNPPNTHAPSKPSIQPLNNTETSERDAKAVEAIQESSQPTQRIEEIARQSKPTRVHKREKELMGLIAFLPLLDASEATPPKKKKTRPKMKEASVEPTDTSSHSVPSTSDDMPSISDKHMKSALTEDTAKNAGESGSSIEPISTEPEKMDKLDADKKPKRSPAKKSSLRRHASKSRRKRVSIVIDDQIVHPSDNIIAQLSSPPPEEAIDSASSSTSSLRSTHTETVPFTIPSYHSPSPPKTLSEVSEPMSLPAAVEVSAQVLATSPPPLEHEEPSPNVIHRTQPITSPTKPLTPEEEADPIFTDSSAPVPTSTYVGGIDGSGIDDMDQAGSYGYPSSLGASYLESYMMSRPRSVRARAAESADLGEREKTIMMAKGERKEKEREEVDVDLEEGRIEDVEEGKEVEDIIGSMEGF